MSHFWRDTPSRLGGWAACGVQAGETGSSRPGSLAGSSSQVAPDGESRD